MPARRRSTPKSSSGSSARSRVTARRRMRLDARRCRSNKFSAQERPSTSPGLSVALWTGFTFVGYFTPIRELGAVLPARAAGALGNLLGLLLRLCHLRQCRLHARAGLQVHVPLCALPERHVRQGHADRHLRRGAWRAAWCPLAQGRSRRRLGLGACVDCSLCVQVCPTGIDIRKGLQYECIGCGACVDVCDTVMDKMGYPRGLVKYTTQNAVQAGLDAAQTLRHVLRPRVLVYTAILAGHRAWPCWSAWRCARRSRWMWCATAACWRASSSGGKIENVYRLQIMNATETDAALHASRSRACPVWRLAVDEDHWSRWGPPQARWVAVRAAAAL